MRDGALALVREKRLGDAFATRAVVITSFRAQGGALSGAGEAVLSA